MSRSAPKVSIEGVSALPAATTMAISAGADEVQQLERKVARFGSVLSNKPPPKVEKKEKGGWRTIVAGAGAGAVDCCFTMPMDTLSTQMQLKKFRSPLATAEAIIAAKGVAGLYAGFVPFLIQSSAKSSVRFLSYEVIANGVDAWLPGQRKANPGFWALTCGLGAGAFEALSLTAPTDRVKVLRQAMSDQKGGRAISAVELVRQQGLSGLYTGALATALRQSSSTAVRFFCYGSIKAQVCAALGYDEKEAPAWVSFLAGGTGGAVSVCLNNPIDVAKSKIQAGVSRGIVSAIAETVRERGLIGLTSGLSVRVPRLFLSQARRTPCTRPRPRRVAARSLPSPLVHAFHPRLCARVQAIQFSLVDTFKRILQNY